MELSDKKGVQLIVRFLAEAGIKNAVLSPGSRNAPLSLSFAHHSGFSVRVIPDERVAAYHALGISLFTQKPTVLVCTSGTAVLNYAPAIAEAYYQHVPLIVITADRPEEWIDQGDGQTIRQKNIFANYILKSFSINGDAESNKELKIINDDLNSAIGTAIEKNGPVHLNVSLNEPLYKLTNDLVNKISVDFEKSYCTSLSEDENSDLKKIWSSARKIMILAGQMQPNAKLNQGLSRLSESANLIVLTESTSNLISEGFISAIDRTIDGFDESDKNNFKPDLLITIGGAIISKKVKAWLRNYKPGQHWKVGKEDIEMDTYRCKTKTLELLAEDFIEAALNWETSESDYRDNWLRLNEKKIQIQKETISQIEFSDLKVFSVLAEKIPAGSLLHLGNSSPVRYVQLFDKRNDLIYYSNRGVSGIDGCTSTAAGMADVSEKRVTLITGDISFFYDSNALWNDYLKNLKVIIINNGGGGIFRIIDQPEDIKDTELLFETRHTRKAEWVTAAFGIKYLSATDEISLDNSIKQLYSDNLPGILEIFTPTEKNPLILKHYFTQLKNK